MCNVHRIKLIFYHNYGVSFFISAIVYAFNIGTLKDAEEDAKQNNVTIKKHNVIYTLIDDIKEEMDNCLPPVEVEDIQGIY